LRSQWAGLAHDIGKRVLRIALVLFLAWVAAKLKLLGILNDKWGDYTWGVSQNLAAALIMIGIEGFDAIALARMRRLVADLRKTMEDVLDYDLAKMDQEAFRISRRDRSALDDAVTRMLSDAVRGRSRLERALGRIDGEVPESRTDIDTGPRGDV